MQGNGFIFDHRINYYKVSKQCDDMISMWENYFEWIQKYRDNGYSIYYQDETWVFKNMTTKNMDRHYRRFYKRFYNDPSGSGERSILNHVISEENGLLDNCMLLCRGSKSNQSADYHSEMNWDVFRDWCKTKVFPAISRTKKKAGLVLQGEHKYMTHFTRLPKSYLRSILSDIFAYF